MSFLKTSLIALSVTVKVEFVDISIVLVSFDATGASFAPVTVKVIVAVSVADPSETV